MSVRIAVAPHFYLTGSLSDRLRIREGDGWRACTEPELADLMRPPESMRDLDAYVCLFVLPGHLREGFWSVMEHGGEFTVFAGEVAELLAFKELPLPPGAACELVVARPGPPAGLVASGSWGVVNLGEDETTVVIDRLSLSLQPGDGCRMPQGIDWDVVPPARETPDVLLVIREGGSAIGLDPRATSPGRSEGG